MNTSMNAIAELGVDFLHGEHLHHAVHYLSLENLKGAAISIAIGAAVYLGVVRTWMRRNGDYVNRWPARVDLEDLLYRPLLLNWLPGFFGWVSALFGENRVTTVLCRWILDSGRRIAALFGENRLTAPLCRWVLEAGGRIAALFGENRMTGPLGGGILSAAKRFAGLFGENMVTAPLSRGVLQTFKTVSHAFSDSLDAIVLFLSRTVQRQSRERTDDKVTGSAAYRLGRRVDAAAIRRGREPAGEERYASLFYRGRQTLRRTNRRITGNLSFALLMLVLAICLIFAYMLWQI